jgi:hypothetical protein
MGLVGTGEGLIDSRMNIHFNSFRISLLSIQSSVMQLQHSCESITFKNREEERKKEKEKAALPPTAIKWSIPCVA